MGRGRRVEGRKKAVVPDPQGRGDTFFLVHCLTQSPGPLPLVLDKPPLRLGCLPCKGPAAGMAALIIGPELNFPTLSTSNQLPPQPISSPAHRPLTSYNRKIAPELQRPRPHSFLESYPSPQGHTPSPINPFLP